MTICLCFSFAAFAGGGPVADFTADKLTANTGETITFTDESESGCGPITTWMWTFEGGTPATSTAQNPTVVFNTPGPKDVTLAITGGVFCDDTEEKLTYITVVAAPEPQDLPLLNRKRLFLFGALIFGAAVLVMVRMNGRS